MVTRNELPLFNTFYEKLFAALYLSELPYSVFDMRHTYPTRRAIYYKTRALVMFDRIMDGKVKNG